MLIGLLSPGRCPECGRGFDLKDPATFAIGIPFLRWAYWAPGLLLSIGGSTLLIACMVVGMHAWGAALWLGVPFAAGSVLGYTVRSRWYVIPLLGLIALSGLIFGFASMNLAGVYCGLVLGALLAGPLVIGAVAGAILRSVLKHSTFSQRQYLPILFMFLVPIGWAALEGRPAPMAPESISTSTAMAGAPDEVWDSIVFYEDVKHPPPWILRLGLARPLRAIGSAIHPGDVKVCFYNKGRIVKRVVEAVRGQRLTFQVIDQQIGYERDVRLISGGFVLTPRDGGTAVTLTTTYEPFLTPRWCWRPFEAYAAHTLHLYVLEGMSMNRESRRIRATSEPAP